MGRTLSDRHRRDLESSGLTSETIEISGCYSLPEAETKDLLGFSAPGGLAFPYLHTAENGSAPYTRLKPDRPFVGKGGKGAKYVSPTKKKYPVGNQAYIPENLPAGTLEDPSAPILVTEGEKKALAANQEGFATVALSGVTCWVTRNGAGDAKPIGDLDLIDWGGRVVTIVFDSDVVTNPGVRREERVAPTYSVRISAA